MVYILPRPALQFISRSFYKKAYPTYFAFIAVVAAGIEWVYCPWVEDQFVNNFNQGRMLPHILPEILKKQAELAAAEAEDDEDEDDE
ncbi:Oidioi.mRNA.OKI2018_I69.PAR.g12340.t1.cds [Oikopleura dioica]|uniref:Oidioi.mRNA.OKI2018_I69.PAR.g12340.t1.cds n=1 Tax=Oikopleura dioica TaxID=34765 RepID=A0ABN7S036_OIKDI|nr:Oidioi.mRNA.OKI2018_I69.PAR.g12340.t1.cds [Oikopleura dioica]